MALLIARNEASGSESGKVDDYYQWQSISERYMVDPLDPLLADSLLTEENSRLAAYQHRVEVTWGEGQERRFELSTVTLGAAL